MTNNMTTNTNFESFLDNTFKEYLKSLPFYLRQEFKDILKLAYKNIVADKDFINRFFIFDILYRKFNPENLDLGNIDIQLVKQGYDSFIVSLFHQYYNPIRADNYLLSVKDTYLKLYFEVQNNAD